MDDVPSDLYSFHFNVIYEDGSEWTVSEDSPTDDDDALHHATGEVNHQYQEDDVFNIEYLGCEKNYSGYPKMYWFAVRITDTNNGEFMRVLSRRMTTKEDALTYAEIEESKVKRKNKRHTYTAIMREIT